MKARITKNISLQRLNTFGLGVKAKYFVEVFSTEDLHELIQHPVYKDQRHMILGGGSNILFTKDYDGLIVKSSIAGAGISEEKDDSILISAGSGMNWHGLVMYCLENQWGGIENLSLIPGTCGGAPIQNIGAYGVEISEVLESVHGIDLDSGNHRSFQNSDCQFLYRESVFKHELKEKIFISSITLRLTKINHRINLRYGAIQDVLKQRNITTPTIKDVSDAVISIRQSKLPDPTVIGNAGSFFKNPTITGAAFEILRKEYPEIPSYQADNQSVKIPAAWLIEQCGWKGKRMGDIGVHPHQALVLVHYGGGNGEEIFQLSLKIQESVKQKFKIDLTTEVNIV